MFLNEQFMDEFQIFAKGAKAAGDQMWVGRYLLERTAEKYGLTINWHCKPVLGDWNGSGMHANFSNSLLRTCGSEEVYTQVLEAFRPVTEEHIAVYGPHNELRLTGLHETQAIDEYSYGVSDRGASIRVPHSFKNNGWKGYLEDRRPNSQGDPYAIASRILKTIEEVPKP